MIDYYKCIIWGYKFSYYIYYSLLTINILYYLHKFQIKWKYINYYKILL